MTDPLQQLKTNTGGGNTGGFVYGYVYLGSENVPAYETRSPTGGTYKVAGGTMTVVDAKKLYVSDEKFRNKWNATVAAAGFSSDPIKARMLWEASVDGAADWYSTSDGKMKVTPQQYLQWYAKGQGIGKKAENLPSRQVYKYDKATINNLIDKTISDTVGRKATPEELKNYSAAIQKMIDEGTVTTSKTRVNPKTGKKESYTVTTPNFTQEKAQAYVEQQVKLQSPKDYERQQGLSFFDWMQKAESMRGGR